MKKLLSLMLALLLVCTLSAAFAEEALKITDVLFERTTLHGDANPYDSDNLISDEAVRLILNAGFSAPTGGNQRSLNFFVVTERERMNTILEGHPYGTPLKTAPLVIILAGDEGNCKYPELHEMDAGLAAASMIAQATDLGLSTCVMSIFPQDERVNAVRAAVDMPETFKPVLMVAFGTPAVDVVASASVENYDETKVHFNAYQQQAVDAASAATEEAEVETAEGAK